MKYLPSGMDRLAEELLECKGINLFQEIIHDDSIIEHKIVHKPATVELFV
jgi:hypothetical protein